MGGWSGYEEPRDITRSLRTDNLDDVLMYYYLRQNLMESDIRHALEEILKSGSESYTDLVSMLKQVFPARFPTPVMVDLDVSKSELSKVLLEMIYYHTIRHDGKGPDMSKYLNDFTKYLNGHSFDDFSKGIGTIKTLVKLGFKEVPLFKIHNAFMGAYLDDRITDMETRSIMVEILKSRDSEGYPKKDSPFKDWAEFYTNKCRWCTNGILEFDIEYQMLSLGQIYDAMQGVFPNGLA